MHACVRVNMHYHKGTTKKTRPHYRYVPRESEARENCVAFSMHDSRLIRFIVLLISFIQLCTPVEFMDSNVGKCIIKYNTYIATTVVRKHTQQQVANGSHTHKSNCQYSFHFSHPGATGVGFLSKGLGNMCLWNHSL